MAEFRFTPGWIYMSVSADQQTQFLPALKRSASDASYPPAKLQKQHATSDISTAMTRNEIFPEFRQDCKYEAVRSADDASYPPANLQKQYATSGKSAAMILNELFPEFRRDCKYEAFMNDVVLRFKCSFTIRGVCYSADASSKKVAKQLACERALRALTPDISIESIYEDVEDRRNATNEWIAASKKQKLLNKKILQQALNFNGSTMQISVEEPLSTTDEARHAICLNVLKEELAIDDEISDTSMPIDDSATSRQIAPHPSPCYALHHLLLRNNKNMQPNIIYDDPRDISAGVGERPLFECRLTINDSFVGKGTSKKAAKRDAAAEALRMLFKAQFSN